MFYCPNCYDSVETEQTECYHCGMKFRPSEIEALRKQVLGYTHWNPEYMHGSRVPEKLVSEGVEVKWVIGGVTGGSCWSSSHLEPRSAEDEPEFEELDNILEVICPKISLLQYKKLCQEVIKTEEDSSRGYYGNCTKYKIKSVNFKVLYDALYSRGLL